MSSMSSTVSTRSWPDQNSGVVMAPIVPPAVISATMPGGTDIPAAGCTTALLGMILVAAVAWVSESCCLSDGGAQPAWRGGAGWPELVPAAAGVLAAQGDDAGGALGGPVHA